MSTRVIATDEVIDLLPEHEAPSPVLIRHMCNILKRQGQIVPLVLDDLGPHGLSTVYAAVELEWATMLVTDTDITSG